MKRSGHRLWLLLALPLVVAIAVAYYFLTETSRQVEAIQSRGGRAVQKYVGPDWRWLDRLHYLRRTNAFDEIIRVWLGAPPEGVAANYRTIGNFRSIRNPGFGDEDMEDLAPILAELGPLDYFAISNCEVTDEGLKHLAGLERVETLYLLELPITDAGLEHVKRIEDLDMLIILGTDVTQEALDEFSEETGVKVYQGGGRK